MHKYSLIIAIFLFVSCNNQESAQLSTDESTPHIEIDNSVQYVDTPSINTEVEIIKIDKKLSLSIGSFFEEFFMFDNGEKIILVDRYQSEISCIDRAGNLLWKPDPPSPEIDRYEVIGSVEFLAKQGKLYIEDHFNFKIDVFDIKDGTFLYSQHNPQITALDFASISEQRIVYDVSNIYLSGAVVDGINFNLMYIDGEGDTKPNFFFPMADKEGKNKVPLNYHNRFNTVNGNVQYRKPFGNILYAISSALDVTPLVQFSLTNGFKFVEYHQSEKEDHVYGWLEKEGFPIPYLAIYMPDSERLFFSYFWNKKLFLSCADQQQTIINPSHFYVFDNQVVRVPEFYSQGKFYQQFFKYEYDYLQAAVKDGLSVNEIAANLERLKTDRSDLDDIYIIAIKFL